MPIHRLEDVKVLLEADAWEMATSRCRQDVQKFGLRRSDVLSMILALQQRDHRKEVGPCQTDFGPVLADDYLLWYDEESKSRCAPNKGFCFYIKLGIHNSSEGDCCLVVSFHADSRP